MKNRDLFLLASLSAAMLLTAAITYWWSTTMRDDIYRSDLEQQFYQNVAGGTVEVSAGKWLSYLKGNIDLHQSLRELNRKNRSAAASLAQLLAILSVFQGALIFTIYRRSKKSG